MQEEHHTAEAIVAILTLRILRSLEEWYILHHSSIHSTTSNISPSRPSPNPSPSSSVVGPLQVISVMAPVTSRDSSSRKMGRLANTPIAPKLHHKAEMLDDALNK